MQITTTSRNDASEESRKGSQDGNRTSEGEEKEGSEKRQEEEGILRHLHLQGRYRYKSQSVGRDIGTGNDLNFSKIDNYLVRLPTLFECLCSTGVEASSSRYWRFFQGHEYHELLRERSVRADCCRSE